MFFLLNKFLVAACVYFDPKSKKKKDDQIKDLKVGLQARVDILKTFL